MRRVWSSSDWFLSARPEYIKCKQQDGINGLFLTDELCMKSDGSTYMGTMAKTASGKACLAWDKQTYNSNDKR